MNTNQTFFELFSLPPSFQLSQSDLESSYQSLQTEYHPDRFVSATDAERLKAVQLTSYINDAYEALTKPLNRAAYLLLLQGVDVEQHEQQDLDPEFLLEQMEQRDFLENVLAQENMDALDDLKSQVKVTLAQAFQEFEAVLDGGSLKLAKAKFYQCQFNDKLLYEIDQAEERLLDY